MTLTMTYLPEDLKVGDIVQVDGKNHKIIKKTTTAVSAERYYWFDRVGDFIGRMLGNKR